MIDRGKKNVLSVMIDGVDYEAAVTKIIDAARAGVPFGVSALAVHGVMTAVLDPSLLYRVNQLKLVVPDGQPVRWALNLLHRTGLRDRVYGPNLTLFVCERAAAEGLPIYLYGSKPGVLDRLSKNLVEKFPSLKIVGSEPSRFRRTDLEEKRQIIKTIKESGARILILGLGCPRQEIWAYEYQDDLSMPILAVGAAFDFHAGNLRQAPSVLQNHGLEWLFRLCMEPKRLWKRYIYLNPYFVWLILNQLVLPGKFSPRTEVVNVESMNYG